MSSLRAIHLRLQSSEVFSDVFFPLCSSNFLAKNDQLVISNPAKTFDELESSPGISFDLPYIVKINYLNNMFDKTYNSKFTNKSF